MAKALILAGLTLALGVTMPANAQVSRCGWELGKWVCRTEPERQRPDPFRGLQQGYQASEGIAADIRRRQAEAADERLATERRRAEAFQLVQTYINAGRCQEARELAYDYWGDDGIKRVNAACQNP